MIANASAKAGLSNTAVSLLQKLVRFWCEVVGRIEVEIAIFAIFKALAYCLGLVHQNLPQHHLNSRNAGDIAFGIGAAQHLLIGINLGRKQHSRFHLLGDGVGRMGNRANELPSASRLFGAIVVS